uniref:Uncharacterized protein n=1 Tax=Cucumis melo TaxID=3656 RepID=A0A9I9E5D8_CUCME
MNNLFMVQPLNRNPSRTIKRVGPFVQVPKTPLKEIPSRDIKPNRDRHLKVATFGRSYTSFRSVRTAQVMFAPRNTRMSTYTCHSSRLAHGHQDQPLLTSKTSSRLACRSQPKRHNTSLEVLVFPCLGPRIYSSGDDRANQYQIQTSKKDIPNSILQNYASLTMFLDDKCPYLYGAP